MRKQYLIIWTLIAVTGCTMPGIPGVPYRMAKSPSPSAQRQASTKAKSSTWTDRLTSWIPGSKETASKQQKAASTAQKPNDRIALDYASGPPTAELYLSMAQMSDQGGNKEHARNMYRQAISMQPNNLDALLGLARLEDREGRLNEALRIYQQAAAAHPQDAKALNDLALCQARSGQLPLSIQTLEQAVRLQPDKALYRNNIAKVLAEMNRVDEAVAHLQAVHPPAVAQYNMGILLQQRGRTDEAIHFFTAASHIDPQLQAASMMLAQLQGNSPVADDGVLPTPMTPSQNGFGVAVGPRYSQPQNFPAETAQVPMGNSPVALPPIR